MPSKHIYVFLLIILSNITLLSTANSDETPGYYSPENVIKFANDLYQQGDYLRAVSEYQRYLFYKPHNSDEIRYRIALCFRLGGKPEQAIQTFETFLQNSQSSQLVSRVYYQIGVSYFLMEEFEKTVKYLDISLPYITERRFRAEAQQLIALSFLKEKKWIDAQRRFKGLLESEVIEVREKAELYTQFAVQGTQLPTRSPFFAGLISTVIPGAGRLYTGRIGDAINSLFIVGVTGWQTYDGFKRDGLSSVKGWTVGTLCGILYVGNIYGSVISARVFNENAADEFLTTLTIQFPY